MTAHIRVDVLFGLFALVPAAFAPAASGQTAGNHLLAALCTGDGQSRSITIPLKPALPGSNGMCCAKGCHAGSSRKRIRA